MAFLTIVTVCYNAEDFIENTIRSVLKQNLKEEIEYIIIDGASTDGTMNIIEGFKEVVDLLISEKDNGIYDAMNKGLSRSTGEYVLFLNAGDYLYSANIIAELQSYGPDVDIFYSDTYLIDSQNTILGTRSDLTTRELPDHLSLSSFKKGLVVSHQSFIPKRSITPLYIPDNLSADIDWIIKCTKSSKRIIRINEIISCFLIGGISDQKKFRSLMDRSKIMMDHYGFFQTILIHLYILLRAILYKINIRI